MPLRSQGYCGVGKASGDPGVSGDFWGSQEGCQGPFRPSGRNRGLPLRRRGGQGPHLAKSWEPRGFSRVAAGFSSYDGDLSLPLGLALGSPIFPSGCEGKLGVALESLQGPRDCSSSCSSSWGCNPTISSSVSPFSSCPQSLPASGSIIFH